ncbi:MAG: sugar ABC transporter permease [Clostridiales bacterium]|nr:sugar ABC transporter permease [Clostridiales bacterium]
MNNAKTTTAVKKSNSKSAPKRKRIASLDKRKARAGWFFVLPFAVGFIAIYLPIIWDSIWLSFNHFKTNRGGGGFTLTFVGWENYRNALFVDPNFVRTLVSGIQQLIFDIPAIVIFSLFVAVLLNQKMLGRAAFRAIFFIPVILSTGLIESIDARNTMLSYMGDEMGGIESGSGQNAAAQIVSALDVERLFANMKVGTEIVDYVVSAINSIYDIVNRSGVQMLIFLAGLQSISPAIYESCQIEGATAWETFWKITFPMISPMILVNAVYTIIDSFTTEANVVMSYIQNEVYTQANGQVISAAMSWMYFLLVIIILAVFAAIASAFVFYQRRDH